MGVQDSIMYFMMKLTMDKSNSSSCTFRAFSSPQSSPKSSISANHVIITDVCYRLSLQWNKLLLAMKKGVFLSRDAHAEKVLARDEKSNEILNIYTCVVCYHMPLKVPYQKLANWQKNIYVKKYCMGTKNKSG